MSKKFERNTGVNEAKVIQVIEIKSLAGEGTTESPAHEVTEYYSTDGVLLARRSYKDKLELGNWLHEALPSDNSHKLAGGNDASE